MVSIRRVALLVGMFSSITTLTYACFYNGLKVCPTFVDYNGMQCTVSTPGKTFPFAHYTAGPGESSAADDGTPHCKYVCTDNSTVNLYTGSSTTGTACGI